MIELERPLLARLREMHVGIHVPDEDTIVFRNVPVNASFFNKPRTNLLVKRPREGTPFLVCLDENLEYTGPDSALATAFAAGVKQEGWRALFLGPSSAATAQDALDCALAAIGFDGREPALPLAGPATKPAAETALLASFATDLTRLAAEDAAENALGRSAEIAAVLAVLLRWGQARMPLIVAESGCGKTNLLHGLARRLAAARPPAGPPEPEDGGQTNDDGEDTPEQHDSSFVIPSFVIGPHAPARLLSVDLGQLFAGTLFHAERENLLARLFKEAAAASDAALALEHADLALTEVPHGHLLLAKAIDSRTRLLGTALPGFLPAFDAAPLARRIHVVHLPELDPAATLAILDAARDRLAAHHGVEIDESCLGICLRASANLAGELPAKALALLDAAAAHAALAGAAVVGPEDIDLAAEGQP